MDREQLILNYFDGELTGEEEREALHLIADDPELRSMLRFEQKVQKAFQEDFNSDSYEVPDGFTKSVMQEIESREYEPVKEPEAAWIWELIELIWKPRQAQWRPAYALAIVLFLAVMAWPELGERQTTIEQSEQGQQQNGEVRMQAASASNEEVWLRFIYIDDQADSVAVAGDFSNWDPIPLTRQEINGDQVWTGLVPMNRGEHRYMFVKNGKEWVTDPLASMQQEDGFGNKNAIIYL